MNSESKKATGSAASIPPQPPPQLPTAPTRQAHQTNTWSRIFRYVFLFSMITLMTIVFCFEGLLFHTLPSSSGISTLSRALDIYATAQQDLESAFTLRRAHEELACSAVEAGAELFPDPFLVPTIRKAWGLTQNTSEHWGCPRACWVKGAMNECERPAIFVDVSTGTLVISVGMTSRSIMRELDGIIEMGLISATRIREIVNEIDRRSSRESWSICARSGLVSSWMWGAGFRILPATTAWAISFTPLDDALANLYDELYQTASRQSKSFRALERLAAQSRKSIRYTKIVISESGGLQAGVRLVKWVDKVLYFVNDFQEDGLNGDRDEEDEWNGERNEEDEDIEAPDKELQGWSLSPFQHARRNFDRVTDVAEVEAGAYSFFPHDGPEELGEVCRILAPSLADGMRKILARGDTRKNSNGVNSLLAIARLIETSAGLAATFRRV